MNRFSLNGSPLNGGGASTLVMALAAVVCSASVAAETVRVVDVQATLSCSATLNSPAEYISKAYANVQGQALLFPASTHNHKSTAALQGSSNLLVYVLRDVPASAAIISGVDIIAVVASTQGGAAFLGSTSLAASATRVQAGYATVPAYGEVALTFAPTVIRNAVSDLQSSGALRAEPHLNNAVDAYSEVVGISSLVGEALCSRLTSVNFTGQTVLNVTSTLIQPGYGNALGITQVTVANPNVKASLLANIGVNSSVSAEAFLIKEAQSTLQSTVVLVSATKQEHAGVIALTGAADVLGVSKVNSPLLASLQGETVVLAEGRRGLLGSVNASSTAEITALLSLVSLANTSFSCSSDLLASAEELNTRSVSVESNLQGTVNIQDKVDLFVVAFADIGVSAESELTSEDLNKRRVALEADISTETFMQAVAYTQHAAQASLVNTASLLSSSEALNLRRVNATGTLLVEAFVEGVPLRTLKAVAAINTLAAFTGTADTVVRLAQVTLSGSGAISAALKLTKPAYTSISSFAELVSDADRFITSTVLFAGKATVYVDTVTNPESYDPEDRTFIRTPDVVDFIRPFIETEFKRAA